MSLAWKIADPVHPQKWTAEVPGLVLKIEEDIPACRCGEHKERLHTHAGSGAPLRYHLWLEPAKGEVRVLVPYSVYVGEYLTLPAAKAAAEHDAPRALRAAADAIERATR